MAESFGSDLGKMSHEASGSVDAGKTGEDIASLFQCLSIQGDSARGGGEKSAMIGEASAAVDVANALQTTIQSLEDGNESRDDVLEPRHKIFLSHSGAQKSFVADLCADLMRCDRHPFFDKLRSSLPLGEKFPGLIFEAIEQCKVGVVVLSEEFFTRSKWPMMELVAMVDESRKPNRKIVIILVFYDVSRERCRDPSVQSSWMSEHWKKWEEEDKGGIDVEKWKSALGLFGSTTSLVKKDGMLDGELRAEIVEAVCKEVISETRWDDSSVEGKARLCMDMCESIYKGVAPNDLEGGVRVVGVYGTGGIGKTTLCQVLCNQLSREYSNKVCHVEFGSGTNVELLQKVLKKLSNLDVERLTNASIKVCHGYLKNNIAKARVFLALDNVSDESKEQAKSYLRASFGDGSVLLVTARSMDQLLCLGVPKEDCFAMPELEQEEARSLFLGHASLKENEIDGGLLEESIKRCYFSKSGSSWSSDGKHYHPLALKVLGSEVGDMIRHDRTKQGALLRRISLFNLSRQKEHPVFSILRSSFDSLREDDQLLFLDIALFIPLFSCYSSEEKYDFILEWLGTVHGMKTDEIKLGLECLRRKSLLENFGDEVGGVSMHDLWLEFAAAEVKDGHFAEYRFLGKFENQVQTLWQVDLKEFSKLGVAKVEFIYSRFGTDLELNVRGLKHVKSLEVASGWIGSVALNGLGTLDNLTYLACNRMASDACVAELGCLTNLRVVVLWCFQGDKLPNMSKLTNLQVLDLSYSDLKRINLRNLASLTRLVVDGCFSLESLDVTGCSSITHVYGLYGLDRLEELRAMGCTSLATLSYYDLPNLQVLDIEPSKILAGFQGRHRKLRKPMRRFKKH